MCSLQASSWTPYAPLCTPSLLLNSSVRTASPLFSNEGRLFCQPSLGGNCGWKFFSKLHSVMMASVRRISKVFTLQIYLVIFMCSSPIISPVKSAITDYTAGFASLFIGLDTMVYSHRVDVLWFIPSARPIIFREVYIMACSMVFSGWRFYLNFSSWPLYIALNLKATTF